MNDILADRLADEEYRSRLGCSIYTIPEYERRARESGVLQNKKPISWKDVEDLLSEDKEHPLGGRMRRICDVNEEVR